MHHKTIFMPHIVSTSNCLIKITRLYIAVHIRYNIVRITTKKLVMPPIVNHKTAIATLSIID